MPVFTEGSPLLPATPNTRPMNFPWCSPWFQNAEPWCCMKQGYYLFTRTGTRETCACRLCEEFRVSSSCQPHFVSLQYHSCPSLWKSVHMGSAQNAQPLPMHKHAHASGSCLAPPQILIYSRRKKILDCLPGPGNEHC